MVKLQFYPTVSQNIEQMKREAQVSNHLSEWACFSFSPEFLVRSVPDPIFRENTLFSATVSDLLIWKSIPVFRPNLWKLYALCVLNPIREVLAFTLKKKEAARKDDFSFLFSCYSFGVWSICLCAFLVP